MSPWLRHLARSAALTFGLAACAPPSPSTHGTSVADAAGAGSVAPTPLVLAAEDGERRARRFSQSAPRFILKVDRRNGGSPELVMGTEDIPVGGSIPAHRHLVADEIVFVHRGSGVVELGTQRTAFTTGATIYIPRRVRITIRNTGAEPISIAFVFSRPGFEEYLRDVSVPEGEPVVPFAAAELAAIRARHERHTVIERP